MAWSRLTCRSSCFTLWVGPPPPRPLCWRSLLLFETASFICSTWEGGVGVGVGVGPGASRPSSEDSPAPSAAGCLQTQPSAVQHRRPPAAALTPRPHAWPLRDADVQL